MSGSLVNSDDPGAMAAQQAAAEAGAQAAADYYEHADGGVTTGTTGSAPVPLPVTGPAAVTGVPFDAQ